jgi:hypothetical protein
VIQTAPVDIDQINDSYETVKVSLLSPRMVEEDNDKSQMLEQIFELGFDTLTA